jgi:sRNA-binding regulator protein Hfq
VEAPRPETPDDPSQDRLLDDALHELNRWVAETQVDDAIELRRRSAWRRSQADEESTMTGMLIDLAEHGRPVTLYLGNGRRHRGTITAVGGDVVELHSSVGERVVVALDALDSVRPMSDATPVPGDGPVPTGVTLAERVRRLADQRERVLIVGRNGEATSGEITAMGRDVLTVALDGGGLAYVSLAALAEVSGLESG